MAGDAIYQFERFRLDARRRVLALDDGTSVPLTPKALAALVMLVERHGQVVEKAVFCSTLWPDTIVTDASLTQTIFYLRKALGESATEHRFIVTVPGRGYSFVAPVQVVSEPAEEPVRIEPSDEPAIVPDPPPSSVPLPEPRSRGRAVVLCAVGALVLIVALAVLVRVRAPAATERAGRPAIALVPFENLSARDEARWLEVGLSQMLGTEVTAGGRARLVGAEIPRAPAAGLSGTGQPRRAREAYNADLVLGGSFAVVTTASAPRLRIDARVVDAKTGETLVSVAEEGAEPELFAIVERLGTDLRKELGWAPLSAGEARVARAGYPRTTEGVRLFAEGSAALARFEPVAARDALLRAAEVEPDCAAVHALLARSWAALGFDRRAQAEVQRALVLADRIAREDRLLIEAQLREIEQAWDAAATIYRTLWTFFPDDPEYGLRLAAAQTRAGHAKDALETVAALRRLPGSAEDPRVDLAESEAVREVSDIARQIEAARAAAAKAEAKKLPLVLAAARLEESRALQLTGRRDEAARALATAKDLYARAGDRSAVGHALNFEALAARERGDLAEARRLYEASLAAYREVGDRAGQTTELNNLGVLALYEGDLERARPVLEEALVALREMENRAGQTRAMLSLGGLERTRGAVAESRRRYDEALAIARAIGNRGDEAACLAGRGVLSLEQGDLAAARADIETARGLVRAAPDGPVAIAAELGLARLELVAGRTREAEAIARALAERTHARKAVAAEADALALQARALARSNSGSEARRIAESAAQLAARGGDRLLQLRVALAVGEAKTASGAARDAVAGLERAAADARQLGAAGLRLSAEALAASARIAAGETSATATLDEVKDAAHRAGLDGVVK